MSPRLKALVLVCALLCASVAPTAAACLAGTSAQEHGCCARKSDCGRAVLQRACCPCTPDGTSTNPVDAFVAPGAAPLLATLVPDGLPSHPGRVSAQAQAAFSLALLKTGQDPPWLLNVSLLI